MVGGVAGGAELIATPHGVRLERLVTGVGEPVTVFAHGLAGDIAGTRPLGSAVSGRKVFFHFRGHGRSERPPGPWTAGDLARDLRAVADLSGATRAVAVSLGTTALCRALADDPVRFDRLVCYLPPALDETRPPRARRRLERVLAAVRARDAAGLTELLATELPDPARHTPAGIRYLGERADQLLRDGLADELLSLWDEPALPSLTALHAVQAPALVIGCVGDELHPVAAAERLAQALPTARLHVYDTPDVLWRHRADLRELISGFLNDRR